MSATTLERLRFILERAAEALKDEGLNLRGILRGLHIALGKFEATEEVLPEHLVDFLEAQENVSRWITLSDECDRRGVLASMEPSEVMLEHEVERVFGLVPGSVNTMLEFVNAAITAGKPPKESRFPTVKDTKLRGILERDLWEAERAAERGLWKSCMVLCGSILEAALYEYLRRNAGWAMDPNKKGIPKHRDGSPKDIGSIEKEEQWKLEELINFAGHNGILDNPDLYHQAVRDPRNLIHPMAELRGNDTVDKETANACLKVLLLALKKISEKPDPK